MIATRHWTVDIFVGEDDGNTYAEATLDDDIGNHVLGMGRARLNPFDADVPEIGDEIAVGRAPHRPRPPVADHRGRGH